MIMKIDESSYNMISIAKGIGILLMVVGHSGCPSVLRNFIYMFHIPLFFIISGYCFKEKYLTDFKLFAIKRIHGLYLPFVKYSILFLLLHNLFFKIGIYNADYGVGIASISYNLSTVVKHLIHIFLLINYEQLISPLWFVATLFEGYFLFYAVRRFVKNYLFGSFVLLAVVLMFVPFANTSLPYFFRSAYAALFLFAGGIIFSMFDSINKLWVTILCVIFVIIGSLFFPTEMPKVDYNTFFPFCICSVAGTIMVMFVSKKVSDNRSFVSSILGYIGNHTMTILIWHFTCFKIVTASILIFKGETLLMVAKFPTISGNAPNRFWLLYGFVGIAIPIIIYKLGNVLKDVISINYIKFKSNNTK